MAVDVRMRGRAAHSAVLRELLLLWEAARRSGGRTITQKSLARLGGIGLSTLNGWLSGRSVPREIDRLAIVAGELARVAGRPVRRARYWAALRDADRAHHGTGATRPGRSGRKSAPDTRSAAETPTDGDAQPTGRRRTRDGAEPAGPQLVHRYRSGPPAARALVDAALDTLRLGHRSTLPAALLTAAAPHYLTECERGALGAGWAAEAWAYLRVDGLETGGALVTAGRISGGPALTGESDEDAEVRLVEALVRELRPERESRAVPPGLWECLTRHAHPADQPVLARAAALRGHAQEALGLLASAAAAGHHTALLEAAALLADSGRTAEAVDRCGAAAEVGVPGALVTAAELLERDGQHERAVGWYERAARAGDTEALCRSAELLGRTGEIDAALERFDTAAGAGHPAAHYRAGRLLLGLDRTDEALGRFERAAADGHPEAPAACARICAAAGRTDQAMVWWERAWEQGVTTVHEAADVWETVGRINEAAAWYERAAATGDETAWYEAAALFARDGQYGNLPWYAHIGDHHALRERGEQCERDGDLAGALSWYRRSAEAGGEAALFQAADMLERNGDRDRAVHWYTLAANRGDTYAMRELGRLLGELGRSRESVTWHRAAARVGGRRVLPEAVRVVEQLDRRSATVSDRPRSRPHPLPGPAVAAAPAAPAEDAEATAAFLLDAVELLKAGGRYFEANLLLSSADRPGQASLREASRMLSGSVSTDAAIEWVQRFADSGDRQAVSEAAEMLEDRGRIDEALDWYAKAAEVGERDALLAAARMLADRRQTERALDWYRRAAEAGVPLAHDEAVLLRQQADGAEAEAVRRRTGRKLQALPGTPGATVVPVQRVQVPAETGSPRPEAVPVVPPVPAPATRRARIPRQSAASGRARN
ncbi:hypothetical protein ACFYS8_21900 [Kitasatospora sp. NPDC004615]|uniref:hypothetical protein n=1 Tax=Kitasatospora sp. NPDC004615 TaxID=3364017 RepID=UPI0036845EDB